MYFITCFVNGTEPHVTDDHYALVCGIFSDQSTIGWKYFLKLKLIKDWIMKLKGEQRMRLEKEDDQIMIKVTRAITTGMFAINLWLSR